MAYHHGQLSVHPRAGFPLPFPPLCPSPLLLGTTFPIEYLHLRFFSQTLLFKGTQAKITIIR